MQDTAQVRLTLPEVPGHSGAHFVDLGDGWLRKIGDEGVGDQGAYMHRLATLGIGPEVRSLGVRSYVIQRMQPLQVDNIIAAFDIAVDLLVKVWRNGSVVHNTSWEVQLNAWMQEQMPEITVPSQLLAELYETPGRITLIHGDPTLCNIMQNEVGKPFLIDARVPEGKIPSFAEVDVGKLLQSAWGWERVMNPAFPHFDTAEAIEHVLAETCCRSIPHTRRALFWAAVHLSRIRYREQKDVAREGTSMPAQRRHQAQTRMIWASQGIKHFLERLVSL